MYIYIKRDEYPDALSVWGVSRHSSSSRSQVRLTAAIQRGRRVHRAAAVGGGGQRRRRPTFWMCWSEQRRALAEGGQGGGF